MVATLPRTQSLVRVTARCRRACGIAASSSRSQVLTQPARAGGGVTWGRSSIGVRWRPRLAVVIVTQLVTRVLGCLATVGRVTF
jgi:hypothetical protein